MILREITQYIESLAPLATQENYDNSGLITGDLSMEVTGALVSLDCIETTVDEAISKRCNLIIAHHPIVFTGLKKITGKNYVERTVIKAIKNDIAIYACHTNFDNYRYGVNHLIGEKIGLKNLRILSPKSNFLYKLVFYVPDSSREEVLLALYNEGAGNIGNYAECSFSVLGQGSFTPQEGSNPFDGKVGERNRVEEYRVEVLVDQWKTSTVLRKLKEVHPYEEVAYEIYAVENENQTIGSGMIGELGMEMDLNDFLAHLKQAFHCSVIRHTKGIGKKIKTVAYCGGAGSFLLKNAIQSKADIFITGDFKYHEFFDADNQIVIADIGHFESEQYTSVGFADILKKKFPKFAVHLTEVDTNPIKYF